ncbi:MAG: phosphopantetheine-binding protein [Bacteroides sp.]
MKQSDILATVQTIFRNLLRNQTLVLTPQSTVNDVEEWDLELHTQLMTAIEQTYHIRFTSQDLLSWKSVGEMVACIANKCE